MSRLIDADRLLKELGQVWNIPDDWDGDIDETCETAFTIIENQPTAYDLDGVIRVLEETKVKAYELRGKPHMDYGTLCGWISATDKAIEIVKGRGLV